MGSNPILSAIIFCALLCFMRLQAVYCLILWCASVFIGVSRRAAVTALQTEAVRFIAPAE